MCKSWMSMRRLESDDELNGGFLAVGRRQRGRAYLILLQADYL